MDSQSLKIIQELDSHIKRRNEIKQMLMNKNISIPNSPDQTISNMPEPNLQPTQSFLYVSMRQELTAKGFNEFRFLGQGAQGLVLVAKEKSTNRRYAIKGIHLRDQNNKVNPIVKKQVEQEVKQLKACKGSPYVLNLIDQFDGKDFTYLVLSECKGTLSQIIEQAPNQRLNELTSIKYAKDIAEGLHYIHNQKCLVNDIKMDNILIDHNGNAVVADFGFADCLSKTNRFGMNECKGNAFYMAPECFNRKDYDGYIQEYQNRGQIVETKPSKASEACSLGYMIYTMISGWRIQLMFNKHMPLIYNQDFSTFTYEKQLRYVIDGLTKFNPKERLSIKEALIILKGIISFEFNLDEKFVQLMNDDIQNVVNQSFNQQIEFVQSFKNQCYPIIQDEVNLMQQIQILMQQGQANNSNQINQLNQTIIQQKQQIQSLDGKVKQLHQELSKRETQNQKMNETNISLKEKISSLEAKLQEFMQKPQQNNTYKFEPQQTQMKMNQQIQQIQPQQVAITKKPCYYLHKWKQTEEICASGGQKCKAYAPKPWGYAYAYAPWDKAPWDKDSAKWKEWKDESAPWDKKKWDDKAWDEEKKKWYAEKEKGWFCEDCDDCSVCRKKFH